MNTTLKPNTTLQGGRYRIERVLGQGGFGITYLAIQSGLDCRVAIKEFFMKELCERNGVSDYVTLGTEGSRDTIIRFREKFLKEAHNIAKLNHPNIIKVRDIFEENGTAYYVMEYVENGSLADKINQIGCLPESDATHIILQVAEALAYVHKNKMNHLDVKPANIMLNRNDQAVLIDFGLSKQYDVQTGSQTSTTPVGISDGYAPMEQYTQGGVGSFSPETDIYSLGATFFKLLTGKTPPSASVVINEGVPLVELEAKKISRETIAVIRKAMEPKKRDRFDDVTTFIKCLKGDRGAAFETSKACLTNDEITVIVDSLKNETSTECKNKQKGQKTSDNKKSSGYLKEKLLIILGLLVVCIFTCYILLSGFNNNVSTDTKPSGFTEAPVVHIYEQVSYNLNEIRSDALKVSSEDEYRQVLDQLKNFKENFESCRAFLTDEEQSGIMTSCYDVVEILKNAKNNLISNRSSVPVSGSVHMDEANGVRFNIVFVQGGTFKMGATSEMKNPHPNELPVHSETINDFYIGQTEVTQALWKAVMGYNPSHFKGDNLPVENVSYDQCVEFTNKLSSITDKKYRLPREAEWEYAARGGKKSRHTQHSGSNNLNEVAWYSDNSGRKTHSVGSKKSNELGIFDMTGNVCEWCSEWYSKYGEESRHEHIVVRDASWNHEARKCRLSDRGSLARTYKGSGLGFRIALSE